MMRPMATSYNKMQSAVTKSRPPKLWPSSIATRRRRAPGTPAEPFADDVRQLDRPRRCLKLKQRRLFLEFAGTLHLERFYRFQSSPSQE